MKTNPLSRFGICSCLAAALLVGSIGCVGGDTPNTTPPDAGGGGSGGGSAGGSAGGQAGGAGGGSGGGSASTAECDGFAAKDASGASFNVETYAYGSSLTSEGCASTIADYTDGTSLTSAAGVYDLDTNDNGAGSPAPALFLGSCSDLGLPGFTPVSSTITPPAGALTIAAAYGSNVVGLTIYGVVTAIDPWTSTGTLKPGALYIQDATASGATAAPKSGSQVYFPKSYAATYGTAPGIGDVIAISNVSWSPYENVNQFAAASGTTVTKLGTSALPTPVLITAANAALSSYLTSSGYEGMRVSINGGPFTIHGSASSHTCPTQLEYVTAGSDGGTTTSDGGTVVGTPTTIAAARTGNVTTPITVTAVVTGLHGAPGDYSQWYIEDPDGGPNSGVAVYCDPDLAACPTIRAPPLYSVVKITGTLSTYMGLEEFIPSSQTLLQDGGTPLAPAEVTMAEVAETGTSAYRGVYVKLTAPTLTVDDLTPAALKDSTCTSLVANDAGTTFGEPTDGGLFACSPPCSPPVYSGFQANAGSGEEVYIENFFFYSEHLQNSPECFTQPGEIPVAVGETFSSMAGILDWDAYAQAQALYPVQDSDYTISGHGGGSGGGTAGGSGGGSAGGSGGGTAGGSGGGSAGGSGGGTAGGSGGGSAGGSGGGSGGGSTIECDGLGAANNSATVLLETYPFSGTLTTEGCATTAAALTDGTSLNAVSGIFDFDTADNGIGAPAPALLIGNCSDLSLPGFTPPTTTTYTPPSGALTVAAALTSKGTGVSVYGVVTAVKGWSTTSTGTLYIQDMPAGSSASPNSGTALFFSKTSAALYGAVPAVGDVVEVTNMNWSPYTYTANTTSVVVPEYVATANTRVSHLATSALPPAVSITASDAISSGYLTSQGYQGMRVTISDVPLQVKGSQASNTCPTQLEYTPGG